jgi:Kdo2-lipid IVA lauroyltransferase/acyltransferase
MSRPRSRTVDWLVYFLIRVVVCVLQTLSPGQARAFAAWLAWLAHRFDRRHRLVAHENLQHAFGSRFSDARRDRTVRAVYRHFCTLLIEIVHTPRKLHPTNWRRHIELPQGRRLIAHLLGDRPLLFVTGHFGNWEMAGYLLGMLGFRTYAVARPLDNPYLDDFLRRFREATGQKILAKHGDFEQMQQILAGRGILATLADQDAGQRGLFVDFFGRPASTHKAVALLALEYRVPLLVIGTPKIAEPMRYRVDLRDAIFPEEYEGRPDAVKAMTQRFTTALEGAVRGAPEQYFWLHRRWKHQPATKAKKRAA